MNISTESLSQTLGEAMEERRKPFMTAVEQGSDRAIAIISACVLDNLLERILRASYVKDPSVKVIFKDDNILQSFFSKISISYFSGLIPKIIYHDLKLICEIRNKFAHEVTANLDFNSTIISQRISRCEIRPKTIDNVPANRVKSINGVTFIIVIHQLIHYLCKYEYLLLRSKPPNLVESFKLNDTPFEKLTLTKEEILQAIQ